MKPQTDNVEFNRLMNDWTRSAKQLLNQLDSWLDALVHRDLQSVQRLQLQIEECLAEFKRLEEVRKGYGGVGEGKGGRVEGWKDGRMEEKPSTINHQLSPLTTPHSLLTILAAQLAREIRERLETCFAIIQNELDYTHAVITMIVRAEESESYAPRRPSTPTSAGLINTEA